MLWLGLIAFASARCEQASGNADLHEALADASAAYAALDAVAYETKMQRIDEHLACMSEVVAPSYAAALHRARGMHAFLKKDFGAAEVHFAAARLLEPAFVFPDSIAPEDNPMSVRYRAISLDTLTARADVPTPRKGSYRLNGQPTASRHQSTPVLLQRLSADGAVIQTEFIDAEAALPADGEKIRAPQTVPVALIAGVVALAGAATCLGGAYASKSTFRTTVDTRDEDAIRKAYRSNLSWNVAAGGFATAGVGLISAQFVLDARKRR